jgi:hypothetical protein
MGAPKFTKEDVSKRGNTMSEDAEKVDRTPDDPQAAELSEREMDNVAGGRSNVAKPVGPTSGTMPRTAPRSVEK